jgi:protein-L-isoaspartate(D-aspartate) O-methyltransferase
MASTSAATWGRVLPWSFASSFWLLVLAGCPARTDERESPLAPASSVSSSAPLERAPDRAAERRELFDAVAGDHPFLSARVLAALKRVPRHEFVPEAFRSDAYSDRPLPIGHGQTISQPAVVATMTEHASPRASDRCLEIGTGSGYQAAVLAELCAKVYSIEYLEPLARFAEQNLRRSGYGPARVELRTGDGYRGWPEAAPFQVIVVTAAPERVPEPLKEQLAVGGRLVIPVGAQDDVQRLELWERKRPGRERAAFEVKELMGVRFVPFLGEGR